jgi:cobalt-zinc-cadmium efflux system outer membrane protein
MRWTVASWTWIAACAAIGLAGEPRARTSVPAQPSRVTRATAEEVVELPSGSIEATSDPLSLADLEQMALENSPAITQATARVQVAQGRWIQAGLPPNPRAGYMADEMGNEGAAGMHGAFVGQEFVTAGKLRKAQSAACFEVQRARALLDAQRWRVLNDVRRAYYDALVAQRAVDLLTELSDVAEQGLRTIEMLEIEAGRRDVLRTRVQARETRLELVAAQARHTTAWRRLVAAASVPDLPPSPLAGDAAADLPQLSWDEALAELLGTSPELAAAQADVERARWMLSRERAEPYPNVEVQAAVQYDDASDDTFANLEVAVPLPLWDRNEGNILRAAGELRAAQAEVRRLELALHDALAVEFESYLAALEQVEAYGTGILPDAQESLDLVQLGFENAELSYLDVLDGRRTLLEANLRYLDALARLRRAATAIEGLLLTGSLGQRAAAAMGSE